MAVDRPTSTPLGFWFCRRCGTPNPGASYIASCLGCGTPRHAADSIAATPPRAATPKSPRRGAWVAWLMWAYTLAMVAVLVVMRTVGERWWATVLLLFFYRWLYLAPLIPLAVLLAWTRRLRLVPVLCATLLLIAGPIMGLSIPWRRLAAGRPQGHALRVLTLNRGGLLNYDALNALIERERIDVLCFQEFTRFNATYVARIAPGFHWSSDRRLLSRYPIVAERIVPPPRPPAKGLEPAFLTLATIRLPGGQEVGVASLDVPSMTMPLAEVRQGRVHPDLIAKHADWRRRSVLLHADALAFPGPLVVAGDFNTPPDSDILRPFRRRFRNGFEEAGWGYGYTFAVARRILRIDHVFATAQWRFTKCQVGPSLGSDHFPLWAELVLAAPESRGPR